MAKKNQRPVWNCLSIRQPYAWAVVMGVKDIENRNWKSGYLGRLHIHAGLKEDDAAVADVTERVAKHLWIPVTAAREAYRHHLEHGLGAIVGSARMIGCATSYDSEWFEGEYGFILEDPELFEKPIPCKGSQRIFKVQPPE